MRKYLLSALLPCLFLLGFFLFSTHSVNADKVRPDPKQTRTCLAGSFPYNTDTPTEVICGRGWESTYGTNPISPNGPGFCVLGIRTAPDCPAGSHPWSTANWIKADCQPLTPDRNRSRCCVPDSINFVGGDGCFNAPSPTPTPTIVYPPGCAHIGELCDNGNNGVSIKCCQSPIHLYCYQPKDRKPGDPEDSCQTTPQTENYPQGSCGTGSICYSGDYSSDHVVPGAQCGTLKNFHWGNDGNGNVPICTPGNGAYCCDPGNPTVNFTYQQPCTKDKNGNCTAVDTGFGSIPIGVTSAISAVFAVLLSLSGGIVLLIIVFSGYRIMTSGGDQEKLKGAREMLTAGIIGLLFIIFSVTILRIIGVDILHIPGFTFK